ncbi:hypothetical protein DFH09DRAFT_1406803 [Mycena vulgaris]|nr:hypothetical protein DFH09DRAFT_1406803 [Mycena vulgaris]
MSIQFILALKLAIRGLDGPTMDDPVAAPPRSRVPAAAMLTVVLLSSSTRKLHYTRPPSLTSRLDLSLASHPIVSLERRFKGNKTPLLFSLVLSPTILYCDQRAKCTQTRPSRPRRLSLASIPEESYFAAQDDVEYTLDLGSGVADSACATPLPSQIKRPIPYRAFRPTRSAASPAKEAERDCGICFELAVAPVRTLCCAHLFCAEHIAAWLHGPRSDGLCPACRAPAGPGLLALGHPALMHLVPRAPPPSRSPSPAASDSDSDCSDSSTASAASYASYPSTPTALSPHADPASEEEDATDYSLPALVHARALQTRRHAPHPFSSVVGVRGALGSVARVAGWLIVVAVLAGRGRWAAD